jgi:hypothetical protein
LAWIGQYPGAWDLLKVSEANGLIFADKEGVDIN